MKKITLAFALFLLFGSTLLANCDKKSFDISSQSETLTIASLLDNLSKECGFSIILKDSNAKDKINGYIYSLNLKSALLRDIFDIVLKENGLEYEYNSRTLKISYLATKTFKIDYVSTQRSGKSSTSVSISGNSESTSTTSSTSTSDSQTETGKSSTEISSDDAFSFWQSIQNELMGVMSRPGEDFNQSATIINKEAGLVTVTGTKEQLKRVEAYIKELQDRLKNQVLIDVNILTVNHSSGSSTGIDWNQLYNLQNVQVPAGENFIGSQNLLGAATQKTTIGTDPSRTYTWGGDNSHQKGASLKVYSQGVTLNRVIEFLKTYGDVNSISNPKVLTLNNQPALISVGNIIRYKKVTTLQTTSTGGTNTNTNDEYPSVFAGVLLDITPSIYDGEIMLKINPSITKTKGVDVESATTALDRPPNLSTNQLSSVVKVKAGERIILGGLISKEKQNDEKRVPLLGDIPLLGYAFRKDVVSDRTEEMIIIITPHIITAQNSVSLRDLGYSKISKIIEDQNSTEINSPSSDGQ